MPELPDQPSRQLLLVDCPDRRGLIHEITGVLGRHGANIVTNDEFVDRELQRFFMRTEFVDAVALEDLQRDVERLVPSPAIVRLGHPGRHRIVVLATREPHCLGELLLRHASGELGATIEAVVSNHGVLRSLTERFGVPFHEAPADGSSRAAHEQAIDAVLARHPADYLVLAKYMRILSPEFVNAHRHRIINIHHSFLPAFAGANPYRQAFERGVKIIGATAHFVTEDLDEGPIIAQAVVPVDHSYRANEMAQAGRDVEKMVLARALALVFDERVFLCGGRTVVFD